MSITLNYTQAMGQDHRIEIRRIKLVMIDPNAVDANGDPDPINQASQAIDR